MKNKIIVLFLSGMVSISLFSQHLKVIKGDREYEKYAYVDAIKTYECLYEKGYKSVDLLQKLGNAYYFNGKLEQAAKWYAVLFVMTADVDPEYYYRYAQSLKGINEYGKADVMMAKFSQKNADDIRTKLAAVQQDYLAIIKKNSGRYTIENSGINSKYSDYGSSFFGDKLIFTSTRDTGDFVKKIDCWTGEGFSALYQASKKEDGKLFSVGCFSKELNSKFHESSPVFTKDGKTVYFTRNNLLNGKIGRDKNEIILLKIYKASLENKVWTNYVELAFNSDNYSVAHPALSSDEKTLYFASNMPGTLGQSDLFKVSIKENGDFGEPQNLGKGINTEGRETFPFVTPENELYFASDGHPGLGGLDVFVSKAEKDGSYTKVYNLGEPLNSSKDDFSFVIDSKTRRGYVSSNREGGEGSDDIYRFIETTKIEYTCEHFLSGIVSNKETETPLGGAKVSLSDSQFKPLKEMVTDANGKFDFGLIDCSSKYYIKTEKTDYITIENPIISIPESGSTFLKVVLDKAIKKLVVGDDLAKILELKRINFDLSKSDIRADAALELSKIFDVLQQNSNMKIDIRSHTDSRQSNSYNQKLSDRRAKATMEWLIKNGINASRLSAKGFGETQLINKCVDGVKCSEAEHQENRRSEFIIVR